MIDKLLQLTLEEIKSGISYNAENKTYTCLICGKNFEMGEIFQMDGKFCDASKAAQLHVEQEHGKMSDLLTSFDKKYTGITENQKELLAMMCSGLTDGEIARKTGAAASTIRHQRFVFREKAKQAKLYLAIYEVVEKASTSNKKRDTRDDLVPIHKGAKMIDDRYETTLAEEAKILASVFTSLEPLKLKTFSSKEKKKLVTLKKIAAQFEPGRKYAEKEVNAVLLAIFDDYATIRRYLIEYGFMQRTKDCKEYWLL